MIFEGCQGKKDITIEDKICPIAIQNNTAFS